MGCNSDGARGPAHLLPGRGVGQLRALYGGAPKRGDESDAGLQGALPTVGIALLLRAPVEPRHENMRAWVHGTPQEVQREHPRRDVPPAAAVHRERGCGRARQFVRVCICLSARLYIFYIYLLPFYSKDKTLEIMIVGRSFVF